MTIGLVFVLFRPWYPRCRPTFVITAFFFSWEKGILLHIVSTGAPLCTAHQLPYPKSRLQGLLRCALQLVRSRNARLCDCDARLCDLPECDPGRWTRDYGECLGSQFRYINNVNINSIQADSPHAKLVSETNETSVLKNTTISNKPCCLLQTSQKIKSMDFGMLYMTFRNIEGILNTVFWIDSSVSSTTRNTEFCAHVQHLNQFTMLKLHVFLLLFRIFCIHIANLSSSNAGTKLLPCTYNYCRNFCTAMMGCT